MQSFFSIITWSVDPWVIPGIEFIRWYGLMWVIGMMVSYRLLSHLCKKEAISTDHLDKLVLYLVLGIILGARLGHILFYDPIYYWNNRIEVLPIRLEPHFEFVGLAGLASHGGVIGALIALYLFVRKYNQPMWWLLDRLTIAAALLGCFIRLGNLMNSEIIGLPTSIPWAFIFTRVDSIPRHPAQLYEAIFYFVIFTTLYLLWRSKRLKQYEGVLFGIGLSLIFLQRFVVEFFKENQVGFEDETLFNMGQLLSIPMVLIGIGVIVWSLRRKRST
ncbi:MAG: prolipoprotein diacylglyceryl transferase [Cyclobacteriaceae bacterium]